MAFVSAVVRLVVRCGPDLGLLFFLVGGAEQAFSFLRASHHWPSGYTGKGSGFVSEFVSRSVSARLRADTREEETETTG
jgi:hypothetical protein